MDSCSKGCFMRYGFGMSKEKGITDLTATMNPFNTFVIIALIPFSFLCLYDQVLYFYQFLSLFLPSFLRKREKNFSGPSINMTIYR